VGNRFLTKLIPIIKANIYSKEIRHPQLTDKPAHFLCTFSYSSTFKYLMSLDPWLRHCNRYCTVLAAVVIEELRAKFVACFFLVDIFEMKYMYDQIIYIIIDSCMIEKSLLIYRKKSFGKLCFLNRMMKHEK